MEKPPHTFKISQFCCVIAKQRTGIFRDLQPWELRHDTLLGT
ncbi:unnamed protein product [Ixodes persulcatus]